MDHTLNEVIIELFESIPPGALCRVRPYNISERYIPLRELEPSGKGRIGVFRGSILMCTKIGNRYRSARDCAWYTHEVSPDNARSKAGYIHIYHGIYSKKHRAFFQCAVCDQTVVVDNDKGRIIEPIVCPREACRARNSMRLVHNRCTFSDKQICRVQETVEETPDGKTPHTISVCLYDDFVETLNAGDR